MNHIACYRKTALTIVLCAVLSWFKVSGQAVPALSFHDGSVWINGITPTVAVHSLSQEQWAAIFRVYTQEAFTKKLNQPVSGIYAWSDSKISFTPHVTFAAGQTYHTIFGLQTFLEGTGSKTQATGNLELSFSIPEEKLPATVIESVHPQAAVLPENMLRMYITFSAPMMPGEAYDHISLLTEEGKLVEKAFLVIDQELWDPERKRFTLLFDPGRVKRGIRSNEQLGAPLQAGQSYTLVIDQAWQDTHGKILGDRYKKTFTVAKAERTKLSMEHWKFDVPTAGSHDALQIQFDRPVDYALAKKYIVVASAPSGTVGGTIELTGSMQWQFVPDRPWEVGEYQIQIHPQLEDVSGNNFNNAFDIDLSREKRVTSTQPLQYSFSIKPLLK